MDAPHPTLKTVHSLPAAAYLCSFKLLLPLCTVQDLYANNHQLADHIGSLFKDLLSEGRAVKPQQDTFESTGDCPELVGQQLLEHFLTPTTHYWLPIPWCATAVCTRPACLAGVCYTMDAQLILDRDMLTSQHHPSIYLFCRQPGPRCYSVSGS